MWRSRWPWYVRAVFGLQCVCTCTRRKRSARSATVMRGAGGAGASPRFKRSMTTAACFRASSVARTPWRSRVTRFSAAEPLDCTTWHLRPVAWTRTPKPAKSRSQNRVSFVSTTRASTVRFVSRRVLRLGIGTPPSNRTRAASIRQALKRTSDQDARESRMTTTAGNATYPAYSHPTTIPVEGPRRWKWHTPFFHRFTAAGPDLAAFAALNAAWGRPGCSTYCQVRLRARTRVRLAKPAICAPSLRESGKFPGWPGRTMPPHPPPRPRESLGQPPERNTPAPPRQVRRVTG